MGKSEKGRGILHFVTKYGGDSEKAIPSEIWSYHVAPIVEVKEGKHIVKKVIDPSLSDVPISIEVWLSKMQASYCPIVKDLKNILDKSGNIGNGKRGCYIASNDYFDLTDLLKDANKLNPKLKMQNNIEYYNEFVSKAKIRQIAADVRSYHNTDDLIKVIEKYPLEDRLRFIDEFPLLLMRIEHQIDNYDLFIKALKGIE